MKMNYKILIILLMLMLLTPKKMVRIFLLTYTELSENELSDLKEYSVQGTEEEDIPVAAVIEMVEKDIAVAPISEMVPVTEMIPVAPNIKEKGTNIFANIYRM